ncbi:MAG: redox-regulated ATPase YchF, partial [Deltaproteobacteria bacterium]|nr:redox-regulated ATPase YchF [Deltaproteobacteria bacterium]
QPVLEKLQKTLHDGKSAKSAALTSAEISLISDLHLITLKPVMYVANGNDSDFKSPSPHIKKLEEYAKKENAQFVLISGATEADLTDMAENEKLPFLQDMGLGESSLARLIHTGYNLLKLITFFTKEGPEVRAWTVKRNSKAPEAAGKIHSDFEKGFIKADVFTYDDLIKYGTETALHSVGKIKTEGHDYVVKDGDIIRFKFSA